MMNKLLFAPLILLVSFQALKSQEKIEARYDYYVQAGFLPNVQEEKWTQEVADEAFLAFMELAYMHRIQHQSDYDLLAWLYNKGVSDEVAMLTADEHTAHLLYILIKEGFSPPGIITTPGGEEELLINYLKTGRGRNFYVINKLFDTGYKANLHTLDIWRRHEYALSTILNHPVNSKFVEDNFYEIAQFLIKEDLLFKVWNFPLFSDFTWAINSLLFDIKEGSNEGIERNLKVVFDFYDILFPKGISSEHVASYSTEILFPILQLSRYALYYDRSVFFEVLQSRYPELLDTQWAILGGGFQVTGLLLDDNPELLNEIIEQEEIRTSNRWLVFELLKRKPDFNLEKLTYTNTFSFKGFSKDLTREFLELSQENINLAMMTASADSIRDEYKVLSRVFEAIINDDAALINEQLESADSYSLLTDACLTWVLSAGSTELIIEVLENNDLYDFIMEDYIEIIADNPHIVDYAKLWEPMGLYRHQLVLWGIALSRNDEELIKLLAGKGFNISELADEVIFLDNLPDEQTAKKAISKGMSVLQRIMSTEYTQPYRILSTKTIKLSHNHVYSDTPLIYYAIAKYSTGFAIELIDLWMDEALDDGQNIVTGENLLCIAVKANRKEIVEHILSLGVSPLNFQGQYRDAMDVAIKYHSLEALEPIIKVMTASDFQAFLRNLFKRHYSHDFTYATQSFLTDKLPDLGRIISVMNAYEFYASYSLNTHMKALLEEQERIIRMVISADESFNPLSDAILNDNEDLAKFIVYEMPEFSTLGEGILLNRVREAINLNWFWLAEILINDNSHLLNEWVDGNTLLHGAIQSGRVEAIEFLLAMGANPNLKNRIDETPYELFQVKQNSFSNYMKLDKLFRSSGASITDSDSHFANLMAKAVIDDDYKQAIKLYREGVDLTGTITRKVWGGEITESYINYASRGGQEVMVFHLLLRGANPNCSFSSQGLNPLSLALLNNNFETARILIQFGADIEVVPDEKAQQYFDGIEPGMSIKQWVYDVRWAGARLFQGEKPKTSAFDDFQHVLDYDQPDSLIALLNSSRSYVMEFFKEEGSDFLNQIFTDKPFDYIRRVFREAESQKHPFVLLHKAASIGRDGLVDLMLSLDSDTASLFQLESPHYKHTIFEYNIKRIIERHTNGNSLIELANFSPSKQYPSLSGEYKKALAYCISMHSLDSGLDTTAMTWNFSRALMHNSPEVFLTLLENYQGVNNELLTIYRAIYEGDISTVKKLLENDIDPNFYWYGCTSLNWAAINKQTDIALLLLEHDVEVTTRRVGHRFMFVEPVNRVWKAPAAWAVITQNKSLAIALFDNGERFADLIMSPGHNDPVYEFLFCYALESGLTKVMEFFIDEGLLMYDYGNNLTNILNRTIKYDNPQLSLKLMEGFGHGETHQAYIDAGFGEEYTAAHSFPTAIRYAISQNAIEVTETFREKLSEFDSVFYTTASLNIALEHAAWDMALDIMSRGVNPDNSLIQNPYRVRRLLTAGTPEVYEALKLRGWDKRRIIRESRRVEPISIVHSPGWISAYMKEGDCIHSASESLMKAMSNSGRFDHLDVFLSNRGMWHSSNSFEVNRTYLSDIKSFSTWQKVIERIMAHERAKI